MLSFTGKEISKNCEKYRIKWDKKSASKIQTAVKNFLRQFWEKHIVYEEFPQFQTQNRVDFLNATKKIAIEVDGNQHDEYVPFFHNNSPENYLNSLERDSLKRQWLELNGYTVIQIKQNEVKNLTNDWIFEKFGINLY